jgi:PAS domain S-box-containing protein
MNPYLATESDYTTNPQLVLKEALAQELNVLNQSLTHLLDADNLSERDLQLLRGLVSLSHFTVQQAIDTSQANLSDTEAIVTALQEEMNYLQSMNAAYHKQLQWFKEQAALSKAAVGRVRLKATMKQCLQSTVEITGAETGSIFLVGNDHVIQDYLLLRQNTTEDERRDLVGKVLQKGLAGWVAQNLVVALIPDTQSDSRWIDFPDQPYKVHSVLCVPMLRDQTLVGILTLTHPDRYYFTQEDADLAWTIAYQTALVMENNRLLADNDVLKNQTKNYQQTWQNLINSPLIGGFLLQNNRFIQTNKRLCGLMGYTPDELTKMQSIASLIGYEDRDVVTKNFQQCLEGSIPSFNLSFGITRKNGQLVKVMAQGTRVVHQKQFALMGVLDSIA